MPLTKDKYAFVGVGYLLVSKLLPKKLVSLVDPEKLSGVTHWVQGLKKRMAGRTDIFLEAEGVIARFRREAIDATGGLK